MTKVADTSLEAWWDIQDHLTASRVRILRLFQGLGESYTRAELSKRGMCGINEVCPRVRELLDRGFLIELPTRNCAITGRTAHPVRLATKDEWHQVQMLGKADVLKTIVKIGKFEVGKHPDGGFWIEYETGADPIGIEVTSERFETAIETMWLEGHRT